MTKLQFKDLLSLNENKTVKPQTLKNYEQIDLNYFIAFLAPASMIALVLFAIFQ